MDQKKAKILLFFLILVVSLYLRFYNIDKVYSFVWDQARDAWKVRDIINGQLVLEGPRTGIGQFHLGPAYYYLLLPFFYLTNLDPMASNYFNILVFIFSLTVIFIIMKKMFSENSALFAILLYGGNYYLIRQNQIPWNVSLVPVISFLVLYVLYRIARGDYRYFVWLALLTGFFFQIHFTAIFLFLIIPAIFLFIKEKKKTVFWALISGPLFLIWLIPILVFNLQHHNEDYYRYLDFIKYYYIGFHFRFLLHRLPDVLIQFEFISHFIELKMLKYILPAIFFVFVFFFEKNKEVRLMGKLILFWLLGVLVGFTLYGGPMSDYYLLLTIPAVFYIIIYLQQKILALNFKPILVMLFIFWIFYFYQNTKDLWVKPNVGGLVLQKESVREMIKNGQKLSYNEGDIKTYLYTIWTERQ